MKHPNHNFLRKTIPYRCYVSSITFRKIRIRIKIYGLFVKYKSTTSTVSKIRENEESQTHETWEQDVKLATIHFPVSPWKPYHGFLIHAQVCVETSRGYKRRQWIGRKRDREGRRRGMRLTVARSKRNKTASCLAVNALNLQKL